MARRSGDYHTNPTNCSLTIKTQWLKSKMAETIRGVWSLLMIETSAFGAGSYGLRVLKANCSGAIPVNIAAKLRTGPCPERIFHALSAIIDWPWTIWSLSWSALPETYLCTLFTLEEENKTPGAKSVLPLAQLRTWLQQGLLNHGCELHQPGMFMLRPAVGMLSQEISRAC